ncbi:hypothetical protein CR513_29349, partial [Mucuna pruriens]
MKKNLVEKGDMRKILEEFLWTHSNVRMVTYELSGYALVWWNQYNKEVRGGRRRNIETWPNLKREIRSRFVLASYARDL